MNENKNVLMTSNELKDLGSKLAEIINQLELHRTSIETLCCLHTLEVCGFENLAYKFFEPAR
ncbi:hypothetical protein [Eremococcus coleocola]|uniref:hypothetical protein n=1 Tax=Eremococcus coleocola TaxID=88132 RepID=UPI00048243EE|nr:hypothetical protein [Eremococcus coleocola]